MGAALKQLATLMAGRMAGSNNKANFIVKGLRTVYIANGTAIVIIWYSAWRNERVEPGKAEFPVPGWSKLKRQFKPDRPERVVAVGEKVTGGGSPSHKTAAIAIVGPPALNRVIGWCNKVSGQYPYVWGGGHTAIGIPSSGTGGTGPKGFDCSGAVSGAVGQLGAEILSQPLTSWQFAEHFPKGEGRYITIYGNFVHCFMKININGTWRWFGTGSDKQADRGGAAWGNNDAGNISEYTACHPPGF